MNMFLYKIVLLLILGTVLLNSQTITELEKKYDQLGKEYLKENNTVDSLSDLVFKRAAVIDNEKKKASPDEDKLVGLMSGSATLSNNLERHQKSLNGLEYNIEQIKQQLYKSYSVIIDSLQALKTAGKEDEQLNSDIFFYTEQRLLVSPKIPMLSFNPEKVLKIDLAKINEPGEKALFMEYLGNALSEVDKLIVNVESESDEVEQIAVLEKRSKRFLEDTEFENGMMPRSISREAGTLNDRSSINGGRDNPGNNEANVKAYYSLLDQLNTKNIQASDLRWNPSINSLGKNLDLKDYQKLLKEVKLRLQELKLVLANKLNYQ